MQTHYAIWTTRICLIGMMLLMSGGMQSSFAELPGWDDKSPRLVGEARFRLFSLTFIMPRFSRRMVFMMVRRPMR